MSAGGRGRPEVRRAAGLVAVAVVVAVVCTGLGLWQWVRHEHRAAEVAVVRANLDAPPVPIGSVLDSPADPLAAAEVWTGVRVKGRYLTDATVLLRNRPVGGGPVLHVLVPFQVSDGAMPGTGAPADGPVLVVDRGWIPADLPAAEIPAPPPGDVELVVRLRADEPASGRDAPPGQVQAISVPQVLAVGGVPAATPAFDAYGALVAETPPPARGLGPLPRPSTDPGSHLSYALQWWTFALGALVGFGILARRELVTPAEPTAGTPAPRRRRGPTAEDVEDALIDAQLR